MAQYPQNSEVMTAKVDNSIHAMGTRPLGRDAEGQSARGRFDEPLAASIIATGRFGSKGRGVGADRNPYGSRGRGR